MTADELKQELTRKFDVVAFVDLADALHKHRSIFDIFKSVHRDAFEDGQRIVLYSAFEPDQSFLNHIQRAAARIDISNFFILISCPHDITKKLVQANRQFGYDDVVIKSMICALEKTKTFGTAGFRDVESICPLPFLQASISMMGTVSPCCKFQKSIGQLTDSSLSDIFVNSQAEIRNQFLANTKPRECAICWNNEAAGTISYRQLAMSKYGDLLDQVALDDPQLREVAWSPVSLCNFTCRICSPIASTSIAAEEIRFSNDAGNKSALKLLIKQTNDNDLREKITRSLLELPHLRSLHLMGGEPFLGPGLADIVDRMISKDLARHVRLEFNTNCSIFPRDLIKTIIDNFRETEILLSVDNVGPRFEIERGGKWPEILDNIQEFAALCSDRVVIKLAPTVNIQNVLYLDDVVKLADRLDLHIVWWYLENPAYLCIDRATPQTKILVRQLYHDHPTAELRNIAHRIAQSPGSDGQEFLAHCAELDRRRGQAFGQTHPEIFQAMGGCV